MHRWHGMLLVVAAGVGNAGCAVHEGETHGARTAHEQEHRTFGGRVAEAGMEAFGDLLAQVVVTLITGGSDAPAESPAVEYPPPPPYGVVAPVADETAPESRGDPFDPTSAVASLHAVDLHVCLARGAPAGYGHARVTFAPDGAVRTVTVDAPVGLSKEAVDCLGDLLGRAAVPAFAGSPVAVGTTFYVH